MLVGDFIPSSAGAAWHRLGLVEGVNVVLREGP